MKKLIASLLVMGTATLSGCIEFGSSSGGSSDGMRWRVPTRLSGDTAAFDGKVGIDDAGNAVAVWFSGSHLWASVKEKGKGFTAPMQVDDATLRVADFSFAMSGSGLGALLWRSEETSGDYFKSRVFNFEDGWDDGTQVMDGLTSDGQRTDVAVSDSGSVAAVWSRYSLGNQVLSRIRDDEGVWGAGATRVDNGVYYSNYPKIAADGEGNAVVVWEQWSGTQTQAFARYYSSSQGWKGVPSIQRLDDAADANVDEAYVEVNADGDGIAFWTEGSTKLLARRFTADSFDGAPTLVATGPGIYRPQAIVAPGGDIVVVWQEPNGQLWDVYARAYFEGAGWDGEKTVVSDQEDADVVDGLVVTANADGEAIAIWSRTDVAASTVYARRWDATKGWAAKIEKAYATSGGSGASVTSARMDEVGRVVAILDVFDLPDYELTEVYALLFY